MGAIPVPLNPAYREIELAEIFSNCQPVAIICEERYHTHLEKYAHGLTTLIRSNRGLTLFNSNIRAEENRDLESWLASINYTYRGSGIPVGAMIPHEQYITGAEVLQEGLKGIQGEKMLVVLPMFHIFTLVGCIFVPLMFGMTMIILQSIHPRKIFDTILSHGIEYVTAVPEILNLLVRLKEIDRSLPSLKAFVSGGSILDQSSYERIRRSFSVDLMHGYGLTEFAPVSRNIRGISRGDTIGPLCRGIELSLDPDPEKGEALIRSEHMARGYINRPGESAKAFVDGWFRTGDLLTRRGDHLVFIRELKNTRKVNGSMVDLEEVKKAVLSFPGVQEAQIVFVDGQIQAEVQFSSSSKVVKEDVLSLKQFLRGRIAEYKIPKRIVGTDTHGYSTTSKRNHVIGLED
jgi:long-chain acyl-CoA synthetase